MGEIKAFWAVLLMLFHMSVRCPCQDQLVMLSAEGANPAWSSIWDTAKKRQHYLSCCNLSPTSIDDCLILFPSLVLEIKCKCAVPQATYLNFYF